MLGTNGYVTDKNLARLPLLKACLKETLRWIAARGSVRQIRCDDYDPCLISGLWGGAHCQGLLSVVTQRSRGSFLISSAWVALPWFLGLQAIVSGTVSVLCFYPMMRGLLGDAWPPRFLLWMSGKRGCIIKFLPRLSSCSLSDWSIAVVSDSPDNNADAINQSDRERYGPRLRFHLSRSAMQHSKKFSWNF